MYYYQDYFGFLIAIAVCTIFSLYASNKVKTAFAKHDKTRCSSGMTGRDAAARLLRAGDANDIALGTVSGTLSDHYNPKQKIVNLSDSTSGSSSIAAVAVAAHEIGHVMQKKDGYGFYNLRTALVPVVNIGARLALPLVLLGMFLDLYSRAAAPELGFRIAMVGVILYGGSFLFALVTLPVELNASRRARAMLLQQGILTQAEMPAAKQVLSAAAMTYLASLLTSLVYFLRFLLQVLSVFGRRKR